ncbi:hypothetical protein V494_01944 [Pseudogymnoascus sp. VKM F-4513 (FW-928)]|nr:hypothetical protein V494_01944 [Pseudogymnoascus sp. VKM F-4513 (FW-928)]
MVYELKGRNVLVTGGSRGLGALICDKFAKEGANVIVNYVSSAAAAEDIAKTIAGEYGVKAFAVKGDMGVEADCVRLVEETIEKLGGVDVIVSNAGWTRFSAIPDLHATTTEDWDTCFAVNVKAQNYLLRTALATFNANPEGGAFIMTSSIAGVGVSGSSLPYCATKAAQLQVMRVFAATQGPKVRCNAVCPGLLLTEWGQKFPEATIKFLEERASLKKVTDLDDCAQSFVDIARNSSMTGQKIVVDSGLCQVIAIKMVTSVDEKVSPEPTVMDSKDDYEETATGVIEAPVERTAADKALIWKQDLRIVPLSAGIYLLCYLDRSNIGNAKTLNSNVHHDLLSDTNMTSYQFTIALMVFLVAYAVFEVPSNYLLKKFSPSKWIAFLMFSWGAVTIGLGGAQSYASVTAVRFLLGVFEAGLFPGLVYYLTFWYRTEERSMRVAIILASATLAGAFGGALAYGIGHMDQAGGLSAWRWLFIIEGIPSVLSSVAVFFYLPDYPETVKWLTVEERALAVERLRVDGSHGHSEGLTWAVAKHTLTDWRLYAHFAIYFGISVPFSSLSLFTPSITAGLGYENLEAQLMTVSPYAVAYVVTIFVSWSADRYNARGLHTAVTAVIGACAFMASALLPATAYQKRYGCLIVACSGSFATIPPLLGWLSSNVESTAATGLAIALNISFGAPGQITGVWIYTADEAKKGYPTGHWVNAGMLFFVAVGAVALALYYRMLNHRILKTGAVGGQPVKKLYSY